MIRVITHTSLAAFFTRLPLLGRKDRPASSTRSTAISSTTTRPSPQAANPSGRRTAHRPRTDLVLVMNRADEALARRYRLGGEIGLSRAWGSPMGADAVSETDGRTYRRELGIPDTAF